MAAERSLSEAQPTAAASRQTPRMTHAEKPDQLKAKRRLIETLDRLAAPRALARDRACDAEHRSGAGHANQARLVHHPPFLSLARFGVSSIEMRSPSGSLIEPQPRIKPSAR